MTKPRTFANGFAAIAALTAGLSSADGAAAAEELQMSFFVGPRHPMVKAVGLDDWFERLIDNEYTVRASDLSATIVKATGSAEEVIADVEKALAESDPTSLKRYMTQIQEFDAIIKGALASSGT